MVNFPVFPTPNQKKKLFFFINKNVFKRQKALLCFASYFRMYLFKYLQNAAMDAG